MPYQRACPGDGPLQAARHGLRRHPRADSGMSARRRERPIRGMTVHLCTRKEFPGGVVAVRDVKPGG
jgi:hypothetical protein